MQTNGAQESGARIECYLVMILSKAVHLPGEDFLTIPNMRQSPSQSIRVTIPGFCNLWLWGRVIYLSYFMINLAVIEAVSVTFFAYHSIGIGTLR